MDADPWEALDLDDSDLPSLLRPCKRKTQISSPQSPTPTHKRDRQSFSQPLNPIPNPSSSPTILPGPAGAVQAAMLRKLQSNNNPCFFGEQEHPLSTQEYIRKAIEHPGLDDDDFSRDPWLSALDFIRREGLVDDGGTIGTPLSLINTEPKMANSKVAQVVAIIKSCTPNGLGDLMVILKDPTGTIDASIHRKVLVQGGFGKDINVGTVLILQKVSVFSPSRSARYLNITLSNVVKAISKDSVPLSQPNPASIAEPTALGIEKSRRPWSQQKASTLSSERNEEIMSSLRQTSYIRGRVHNDKGIEVDEAFGSSCCIDGRNRNQNTFAGNEPSVRKDTFSRTKKAALLPDTNEHEENVVPEKQPSLKNLAGRKNQLESNQRSTGSNLSDTGNKEHVTKNGDKKQMQSSISRGSLPQWTDEQLDELCNFD